MSLINVQCTNCGGQIQLDNEKSEGFCLYCGTKVILKDVITNINISNMPNVANYIKIAYNAYVDRNYAESERYYNKVLEVDAENWKAIFYKGMSIGWQSTLANVRLRDAISGALRAVIIAAQKEKKTVVDEFRLECAREIQNLATVFGNNADDHYNKYEKTKDSTNEYWSNLDVSMEALDVALRFTSELDDASVREAKKAILENIIELIKFKSVPRQIFVGRNNDLSKRYNWIGINDEARAVLLKNLDDYSQKLQNLDPDFKKPEIPQKAPGCYIATAVYGSYDAYEVVVLRRFRDEFLMQSLLGRFFIKAYYKYGPIFAIAVKKTPSVSRNIRKLLDRFVAYYDNGY